MESLIELSERGLVPSPVVRLGIRALLRRRKASIENFDLASYCERLRSSAIALETKAANDQHYEVPAAFYHKVLGPHLKYSGCYFEDHRTSLGDAEAAMLRLSCERAELQDGQRILELGCGWGSLTLWMAAQYPQARITAVSNSSSQKKFIDAQAAARGLTNIEVITCDMNVFEPGKIFDRVVSIEMFEHMRNYEELMSRISRWLASGGKLFVHIFAHRSSAYVFEAKGAADWMGKYFFTGGQMPSHELLPQFQRDLRLEESWIVDGTHYQRTAEAWAQNLEARRKEVLPVLAQTYGEKDKERWFWRWKIFFLACAELFGFNNGKEWWVSHYRFVKP